MGATRLRFLVAVVALGFVFALVLGAAGVGGNAKAFGAGTTLTIISGDVSVRHGAAAFTVASDGEVLNEGDAIRTGADGRAVLTYFEGSTVTIEPATELAIDAANATADGSTVVLMTQSVGRTWHVVTKLITGGSKYEVRTPASTASVRGTEFQVDADSATTTVSTTEGTVIASVVDPASPGAVVDVPVTAGATQTQTRNAPPAPARTKADPERKVTVTVGATNTLIVDPLGRANGVTRDGKLVVQTPGAQVKRDGDKIVVSLPNLPDGKLGTQVDKRDDSDTSAASVETKVEENGRIVLVDDRAVTKTGTDKKSAGVELKRGSSGGTEGRTLDDTEKQTLPAGKTANPRGLPRNTDHTATPAPTRRVAPSAARTPSPSPSASLVNGRLIPEGAATPRPTQSVRPDGARNGGAKEGSPTEARAAISGFVPASDLVRLPGSTPAPTATPVSSSQP